MGLVGYYHEFIANYARIALLLMKQLKKDRLGWNANAEKAFQELENAMMSAPMFVMSDFNHLFIVEIDASEFVLGVVLMQEQEPIAFFSHTLGAWARMKSIYKKNLMAIVFASLNRGRICSKNASRFAWINKA